MNFKNLLSIYLFAFFFSFNLNIIFIFIECFSIGFINSINLFLNIFLFNLFICKYI